MDHNLGTESIQSLDHRKSRRLTDITRVGFEGQSQHGHSSPVDAAQLGTNDLNEAIGLPLVGTKHCLEKGHRATDLIPERGQSSNVLWQAAATETTTRLQERDDGGRHRLAATISRREIPRRMHPPHDVDRVDATDGGAEIGDLVRERDHCSEHCVRGILDHLRCTRVRDHEFGVVESPVEIDQGCNRTLIDAPDDDTIGSHEVLHGGSFRQELGIHTHTERDTRHLAGSGLERGNDCLIGGARNDRTLHGHHVIVGLVGQDSTDFGCRLLHIAEIDLTAVEGRTDGDQSDIGASHRCREVGGCSETVPQCSFEDVFQTGFVDREISSVELLHTLNIHVDAYDLTAEIGQAYSGDQSDVPCAYDRNAPHRSSPRRFSRYQTSVRRNPSSSPK